MEGLLPPKIIPELESTPEFWRGKVQNNKGGPRGARHCITHACITYASHSSHATHCSRAHHVHRDALAWIVSKMAAWLENNRECDPVAYKQPHTVHTEQAVHRRRGICARDSGSGWAVRAWDAPRSPCSQESPHKMSMAQEVEVRTASLTSAW